MNTYDFTLRYRLGDVHSDPGDQVDALAQAGCKDALVGIGQNGRVSLNFIREAGSAYEAVTSAVEDVQRAIPDAKLVEATPDFVGVTDIAGLFGVSRQYIRQLIQSKGAAFPEPVHEGKPSLWHLADVLSWFSEQQAQTVAAEIHEVSRVNMQLNLFRSCARASAALPDGFRFTARANNHELQDTLCRATRPD